MNSPSEPGSEIRRPAKVQASEREDDVEYNIDSI